MKKSYVQFRLQFATTKAMHIAHLSRPALFGIQGAITQDTHASNLGIGIKFRDAW